MSPVSCLADQRVSVQAIPIHEEGAVQVRSLVTKDLVGLNVIGMAPGIERSQAEHDWQEHQRQQGECSARRFEHPAENAPLPGRQMLNHDERHRAERDSEEQHVGDEPRPKEVVATDEKPERAKGQPGEANPESAGADSVELGGRGISHLHVSVPPGPAHPAWQAD
jgi:hypothetical protein